MVQGDESQANIEFINPADNNPYTGIVSVSSLDGTGLYGESTDFILPEKKAMFEGYYSQEQYVPISYFRWILYKMQTNSDEVDEIIEDTGMIPSVDFKFFYDGFLNDENYAIQLFVQTLDNVEAHTGLIKFKASYIGYTIENMVNSQNSPIEHGIIVEWSNLRLIQGRVDGEYEYLDDVPKENHTAGRLKKDAVLTFDTDKGKPLSLDFDSNQVLSIRFDEDRILERQVYYTASGLDDNGEVIYKALELIPDENTQETGWVTLEYSIQTANDLQTFDQRIIDSPLYWYIIVMTSKGMTVYTKYAEGLFPALDQFPNLNRFTGLHTLNPAALVYRDEPSNEVTYDYQKIVDRYGNDIRDEG